MLAAQWVAIVLSTVLGGAALWVSIRNDAIAREALDLAEAVDARYVIPWELTHVAGNRYRLENTGDEDAHGVVIAGLNVHQGPRSTTAWRHGHRWSSLRLPRCSWGGTR